MHFEETWSDFSSLQEGSRFEAVLCGQRVRSSLGKRHVVKQEACGEPHPA